MGLVVRTHFRGGESGREACGVRKSPARSYSDCLKLVGLVVKLVVTAADTRVGDADVSGRSEGGVTTPL